MRKAGGKRHRTATKAYGQREHAKARAEQRYGLRLNRHDLQAMGQQIRSGRARHIATKTNRISIFEVTVRDVRCRVAYDRKRKQVATVLGPAMS